MNTYWFHQLKLSMVLLLCAVATSCAESSAPQGGANLLTSGTTFQRSDGLTFRYPVGWSAEEDEDGVALTSPGTGSELYLLTTDESEGFSQPDHPELLEWVGEDIIGLAPFLRRVGEVETSDMIPFPHALLTFEGQNPQGGTTRARLLVAIRKGMLTHFLTLGTKEQLLERDSLFRSIFSTLQIREQAGTGNPPAPGEQPMPNPLANGDPYVGQFQNPQLQVDVTMEQETYTGTIQFSGQRYTFTAQEQEDALRGVFQAQGQSFPFTASLKGSALAFTTGDMTYILERQANTGAFPTQKNGNTYRHPAGFGFWYPEGWQVQSNQTGVSLTPPDASTIGQEATEMYFILAEPAQGVSRPDDPGVIQLIGQQLQQQLPFLRSTGNTVNVKTEAGIGAIVVWEGQNPTGMQVRARVYVT